MVIRYTQTVLIQPCSFLSKMYSSGISMVSEHQKVRIWIFKEWPEKMCVCWPAGDTL